MPMRILLTGITGNVGHELAHAFKRQDHTVLPLVRASSIDRLEGFGSQFERVIPGDLLGEHVSISNLTVDALVHAAGVVRFHDGERSNVRMMERVLTIADELRAPVYFVSTAFVHPSQGESSKSFSNAYEEDKFNAEEVLRASGLPHGIFRPSVMVGSSISGALQNWSGYYALVRALHRAVHAAGQHGRIVRFPMLSGTSDMVPVNIAAEHMRDAIIAGASDSSFITNPEAPRSSWVLQQTLQHLGAEKSVEVLDAPLDVFSKLSLSPEELELSQFLHHFEKYLTHAYAFPSTLCTRSYISEEYMHMTLNRYLHAHD